MTHSATGTTILTGTDTYTGTTSINAGTLQIGDGGTSGTLGSGDVANNSVLAFNRSDVITVDNLISDTGRLVQSGSGTLILTGSKTYSGGTMINSGTLQIGNGGTTGSIVGDIANGSTIDFNRSDTAIYSGGISGTGSLVQSGSGALILTGANTHGGGTTISSGTLQIGNGVLPVFMREWRNNSFRSPGWPTSVVVMCPLLLFSNPHVTYDIDRFCRLIKSEGGTLGDGVISDREAVTRLTAFVAKLYAIVGGRCDFWPLMEAYQVGFGSKCYSFHGLEGTLVNGLGWEVDGLKTTAQDQYFQLPISYDSIVTGPHWLAAVYKRSLDTADITAMFDFSNDVSGGMLGRYSWLDDTSANNRRAFSYTENNNWGIAQAVGPSPAGSWNCYVAGFTSDRTGAYIYQNGSLLQAKPGQIVNPSGALVNRRMLLARTHTGTGNYGAMMAFGLIRSGSIDAGTQAIIYNAYKATLGKDLGLT